MSAGALSVSMLSRDGVPQLIEGLRLVNVAYRTNVRGTVEIEATWTCQPTVGYALLERIGHMLLRVDAHGVPIAAGRIEDASVSQSTLTLRAGGPWRELRDSVLTTMWSVHGVQEWEPVTRSISGVSYYVPEYYRFIKDNECIIALTKNTIYPYASVGAMHYRVPHTSNRLVSGMIIEIVHALPTTWRVDVNSHAAGDIGNYGASSMILAANGTGALSRRAWYASFTAAPVIVVGVYNNNPSSYTMTQETGTLYARVQRVRLVSNTDLIVNTTITAAVSAGSNVLVSVGSTDRMYVGMEIVVNSGAMSSEIAVISEIVSATQCRVAQLVNGYGVGVTVHGLYIPSDLIVRNLADSAAGQGVLRADGHLIESCPRDNVNAVWHDAIPAEIIGDLAERGTRTARYEAGVTADGYLWFRDEHSALRGGQTWYVEVGDIALEQSLEALTNRVYATYRGADNSTQRTADVSDQQSVARYGLIRRGVVDSDAPDVTRALARAALGVRQTATLSPLTRITISRVYSPANAPAPLWLIQPGDTIVIRNVPLDIATDSGQTGISFRIGEIRYDGSSNQIEVQPETTTPSAEHQLAALIALIGSVAAVGQAPGALPAGVIPLEQLRRGGAPGGSGPAISA